MRDRRARCAFLVLILGLPLIIGASTPARPAWAGGLSTSASPITGQVELLIIAGLMYAGVERRRLLAGGIGPADRA